MPITKKGFEFHTLRPILANPGYRQKRGCLKTDALAKTPGKDFNQMLRRVPSIFERVAALNACRER